MSDELEVEIQQPESQESELDYKTEYEKAKQESENWRSQFQRRDSEYRAQHGQLKPAQKELARLKALEDSLKKKKETHKDWEQFEKDFPDEAKAHNARLTPYEQRMEELERRHEELQQRYAERDKAYTRKERLNNVLSKHPDFMEVVSSKEFSEFGLRLPKALKIAFENQDDPDDEVHIHVLDLFKREHANKPANTKADYVQTKGVAPKAKQTQLGVGESGSQDPEEQRYLDSLARAKKSRSN